MSGKIGLSRRGTILKYNNDGSVLVGIDEMGLQQPPQKFNVPMPLAWAGPNGEFIGGFPSRGSSVVMSQGQGGQWFIESYIPSGVTFSQDQMDMLLSGRALIQTKNQKHIFVDPSLGIQAGNSDVYMHIDPDRKILSHNLQAEMTFTAGRRYISGIIKRDLVENSNRNIIGSTLTSHIYDDSLSSISMDPSASSNVRSSGDRVRNPLLTEQHEIVYEFDNEFNVQPDSDEAAIITNGNAAQLPLNNGRKDNRTDALSLGQYFPNHLMETIKGTAVDIFGNIVDINRNSLPIGKLSDVSLLSNPDKVDAFAKIKGQLKKSIAFHWEINTKHSLPVDPITGFDQISSIPDTTATMVVDYSRNRSRFFVDIDKEGQFKINVPASSETGNIPLLTRYENYSTLLAQSNGNTNLNNFVKNANYQDIYVDSFAGKAAIKLSASDSTLDGYASPIDRITQVPIMMGTAYHDITLACNTFLPNGGSIVLFDPDNTLNQLTPYDLLVSPTIIVSGAKANAGGRSGAINLDGMFVLNVGANTIDRQSAWYDYAGGIVAQIGRDLRGISYAAQLDGDMIVQIGGNGIGNTFDSRFATQNDAARPGTLDIRVLKGDGQMTIVRIDQTGVRIATQGRLDIESEQTMNFKSRSDIYFSAENIIMYADSTVPRKVLRGKKISI